MLWLSKELLNHVEHHVWSVFWGVVAGPTSNHVLWLKSCFPAPTLSLSITGFHTLFCHLTGNLEVVFKLFAAWKDATVSTSTPRHPLLSFQSSFIWMLLEKSLSLSLCWLPSLPSLPRILQWIIPQRVPRATCCILSSWAQTAVREKRSDIQQTRARTPKEAFCYSWYMPPPLAPLSRSLIGMLQQVHPSLW